MLRWRMVGDLQVGFRLRPRFGQRPEAALEHQPAQPVDAVADHADGARRTSPRVPMVGSQRLGRRPQVAWVDPVVLSVFHPGAVGQGQQGRYRQHQSTDSGMGFIRVYGWQDYGLDDGFQASACDAWTIPESATTAVYAVQYGANPLLFQIPLP